MQQQGKAGAAATAGGTPGTALGTPNTWPCPLSREQPANYKGPAFSKWSLGFSLASFPLSPPLLLISSLAWPGKVLAGDFLAETCLVAPTVPGLVQRPSFQEFEPLHSGILRFILCLVRVWGASCLPSLRRHTQSTERTKNVERCEQGYNGIVPASAPSLEWFAKLITFGGPDMEGGAVAKRAP